MLIEKLRDEFAKSLQRDPFNEIDHMLYQALNEALETIDDLRADLELENHYVDDLLADLDSTNDENDELQEQIEFLRESNEELLGELNAWRQSYEALKIGDLERRITRLQTENAELQEDNKRLREAQQQTVIGPFTNYPSGPYTGITRNP